MKPRILALVLTILVPLASHAQHLTERLVTSKTVSVAPTVIGNVDKVKDPSAATMFETALRNALVRSGFTLGESPTRMYLVLDEFTAGNAAKRALVGFGTGRSKVSVRLVVERDGEPVRSVKIETRGRLMFSAYEADEAQQRHALNEFEQRLVREIKQN
jgi:hypothetical protein